MTTSLAYISLMAIPLQNIRKDNVITDAKIKQHRYGNKLSGSLIQHQLRRSMLM